jgi:hypothetical protein
MCTVTLAISDDLDVPMSVNITYNGPNDQVLTSITTEEAVVTTSTATNISTTILTSFSRNNVGFYSCTARVSSTTRFLAPSTYYTSELLQLIIGK